MPTFAPYLQSNPFGNIPVDFAKQTFDFIDEREDGGIDKALHPGVHFGPWIFNFNSTRSTPIGNATVTDFGGDAAFNCVAHGLLEGDQVRLETSGILPTGFLNTVYYYVRIPIPDTFGLSLTSGGSLIAFTDAGLGNLVIVKRGTPYDFTGWNVFSWVKTDPNDDDGDKLLDLSPTFLDAANGQVAITVTGPVSWDLADAKAFWDMVLSPSGDADRFGAWVAGRFDISKLVTHPPFA